MESHSIVRAGGGKDYDYSQDHCFVKLASNETDGHLCFVEDQLKPGFRLGRHHHKIMTEVFYVLEGEVAFEFDDETLTTGPGDSLTVPPNVWHAAECKNGGRMLTVFLKGRFDEYLERLNSMSAQDFENAELMQQINAEFDIYES